MSVDCECIVVGAGVVGLAIARRLAMEGREVLVLESEAHFGTVTSARNSEVIHAGIYYAADSLKARLCVAGRDALYRYCLDHHVPHRRCGKLIVATSENQLNQLEGIRQRALANGVSDICALSSDEARVMEPQLQCLAALHSPSTGIVDSHALMLSLLGQAEGEGAMLATHSPVKQVQYDENRRSYRVEVDGPDAMSLTTRYLVLSAGHGTASLAGDLLHGRGVPSVQPLLSKGNYFRLAGKAPFSRLIYPVPEAGGLGVHITLDLAGQARFGPDVEAIDTEDYTVDTQRAEVFYANVRRYWPGLPDASLSADYAGIRPKIRVDGELYPDFLIQSGAQHGLPGLVCLFGIESPGLTASLALADEVQQRLSMA